ncbi:hypothetical protein [Chengkuizengella axinellae]|uniref:Uncharacterized protein n=1 Tax=Chengkuizengella axinellae TaxID=3064388 RepID=A0ABT9J1K2_9BACL|nr:hypothetical protein [Chengkuizengella sp. 2205SS18-9]MDP5275496.1 hypothetical protein [Chengkuizengella sp. 2205SS18-9]
MAGFNKDPLIVCNNRFDVIDIPTDSEVMLEVKVCVKDKNKTVKLDWSADEFLTVTFIPETGDQEITFDPIVTAEYTLCKNNEIIPEATVTSSLSNTLVLGLDGVDFTGSNFLTLNQNNQPNFTFCDTSPVLGVNCYQVKFRLTSDQTFENNSSGTVGNRTLNAICGEKDKSSN